MTDRTHHRRPSVKKKRSSEKKKNKEGRELVEGNDPGDKTLAIYKKIPQWLGYATSGLTAIRLAIGGKLG